jgi:hypothetical protein
MPFTVAESLDFSQIVYFSELGLGSSAVFAPPILFLFVVFVRNEVCPVLLTLLVSLVWVFDKSLSA